MQYYCYSNNNNNNSQNNPVPINKHIYKLILGSNRDLIVSASTGPGNLSPSLFRRTARGAEARARETERDGEERRGEERRGAAVEPGKQGRRALPRLIVLPLSRAICVLGFGS